MADALFAFEAVVVEAGGRRILDGVTAELPDRGVTCLVGPSGSGKSTMLRLCNRLEVPTSGVVRFRGTDLAELDVLAHRRRVGMVFQRPTPFPGTVRDNLLVARPGTDDGVLGVVLERAALPEHFLDRVADELSGGEAQRMCLARTLVTDPEVLLMDEPTSSLDADAAKELERLARRLADDGVPVVWVSHDLAQVDRIADARLLVDQGRVHRG
ncbi:MAG TPA: phosphate ABC transporter ATP-binding protein [Acidimicrobiales bacterium]|nr:phosphate ABC transporter ATP-binding protein [Acidimicrobiales bacterium]